MRKLGEQWIEVIDGQEHMVKAVKPVELCQGCLYNGNGGGCWWSGFDDECEMGYRFIIKDLGPVNEDGCLAEERTGLFPKVSQVFDNLWKAFIYVNNDLEHIEVVVYGKTKQQAIDAWNRRTV